MTKVRCHSLFLHGRDHILEGGSSGTVEPGEYDLARGTAMRRLIGFCLILLHLSGPIIAMMPTGAESRLPACCRRHGAHHCSMNPAERIAMEGVAPHFTSPASKCPFRPAIVCAARVSAHYRRCGVYIFPAPSCLRVSTPQPRSKQCIPRDCSLGKRGPPSPLA